MWSRVTDGERAKPTALAQEVSVGSFILEQEVFRINNEVTAYALSLSVIS